MPSRQYGQDRQRQLEDQSQGDQHRGEERVVVARPELVVEGVVVEVDEEIDRRRQDDEVGEGDAGDEERGREQHQRQDCAPLLPRERRQHVGVDLVDDHRQRKQDREVGAQRQGRGERLGRPESDQPAEPNVLGNRVVGDVEQGLVLPEAERHRDHQRRDADDDPGAKLVEVLDEGEAILMADGLDAGHGAGLSSASRRLPRPRWPRPSRPWPARGRAPARGSPRRPPRRRPCCLR